jgi:hypothetical protein
MAPSRRQRILRRLAVLAAQGAAVRRQVLQRLCLLLTVHLVCCLDHWEPAAMHTQTPRPDPDACGKHIKADSALSKVL